MLLGGYGVLDQAMAFVKTTGKSNKKKRCKRIFNVEHPLVIGYLEKIHLFFWNNIFIR